MHGVLPDVNLLLAFGWRSHPEHRKAREWFAALPGFFTCPITELGFLRVSMSPAYKATQSDAMQVLGSLLSRKEAVFLPCDLPASGLPAVSGYKDTTDSYLVELARKHSCRLATLDEGILAASWTQGGAFHPFRV